ncbi:hypothetical protein [Halomonas piscis]|uniref:hypothetical protein n=1 Tax=Halomonas piscis TaxID=3031727 RepID=UPI00289B253B|nr:hypothetical protein [Halomonas piscis]
MRRFPLPRRRRWRLLLGTLAAAGALFGWQRVPATPAGVLFWPLWVAATQVIYTGALESARLRRHAWLGQYLKPASPWHRRLGGGAFMIGRVQLTSAFLALVLLVSLRRLGAADVALLTLAPGLFSLCQRCLDARLHSHIIERYRPALVRRLCVFGVAAVLSLGLVLVRLWQPQPYMVDTAWQTAISSHAVAATGPTLLGSLERLASAMELTGFWLMQNTLGRFDVSQGISLLAWAIMLLMQATLAWSLSRLLAGIAALHARCASPEESAELRPLPWSE